MQEEIIKKASEMFLKYGLRSVSVDDVCSEMRISKKTFYNIFKTKENLVEKLLEKVLMDSVKVKIEEKEGKTVLDIMHESTSRLIARQALVEKHVAFIYDLEKYYPVLYKRFSEKMDEVKFQQTAAFVRMGQREGIFRMDMNVDIAVKVTQEMIKVALTKIPGTTIAERSEEVLDYLLRILVKS